VSESEFNKRIKNWIERTERTIARLRAVKSGALTFRSVPVKAHWVERFRVRGHERMIAGRP
jgi:hypothetical protein